MDKPNFVRIGFATTNNKNINEHFGRAENFLIYDVSKDETVKVDQLKFSSQPEPQSENHADRHVEKIQALSSCHIIISSSIGGPVAARLTRKKIHPLVMKDNPTIEETLNQFTTMLNGVVPPWLRKVVNGDITPPYEGTTQCQCDQ